MSFEVGDIVLIKRAKRRGKVTRIVTEKGPDVYAVQVFDFHASHYYDADDLELVEKARATDEVYGEDPRRPQHPDFWRASAVITGNDATMDDAKPSEKEDTWKRITGAAVDVQSVTYMAQQRVLRAFGRPKDMTEAMQHATIASLWIDGFLAGVGFEKEGGHRAT